MITSTTANQQRVHSPKIMSRLRKKKPVHITLSVKKTSVEVKTTVLFNSSHLIMLIFRRGALLATKVSLGNLFACQGVPAPATRNAVSLEPEPGTYHT